MKNKITEIPDDSQVTLTGTNHLKAAQETEREGHLKFGGRRKP